MHAGARLGRAHRSRDDAEDGGRRADADGRRPRRDAASRSNAMTRWLRGSAVATGTIAMTALAMVYPLYARGEAWIGAKWVLWYALFAIVLVPAVIYKMTLGTDGR